MGIEQGAEIGKNRDWHPPERTPRPEVKYEGKPTGRIHDLLAQGAISPERPSYVARFLGKGKNYSIDLPKAISVLEGFRQEELPQDIRAECGPELLGRSQEVFRKVVKSFVERGIVPRPLAVEVGRLLRPSNVEITKKGPHWFSYREDVFPPTPQERATLAISAELAVRREKDLRRTSKRAGINLTDEQIQEVALRESVSHEYGHAVGRTLLLSRVEKENVKQRDEELEVAAISVGNRFSAEVFNRIAPDGELEKILEKEPEGVFQRRSKRAVTSERVATGFEYLGLRYALEDVGVEPGKAGEFVASYLEEDHRWFREYTSLIEEIRSGGWELEDFSDALSELRGLLKEWGREDLLDQFPSFGLKNLGYLRPLNEEQIKELVRQ